jgi:hypothetical protein
MFNAIVTQKILPEKMILLASAAHNVRCSGAGRRDFAAEAIARKLPACIFFM